MSAFQEYVAVIKKKLALGDATENTYRKALEDLLLAVGGGITVTNEPRRIACGAPDFSITRNKVPVGHVETKDIAANLDEMERGKGANGDQFKRYRDALPNWVLTDYLEFRWFVAGEKRLTVRIVDIDKTGKFHPSPEGEKAVAQLLASFLTQTAPTVTSAEELAKRMAGMTRNVRDLISNTFSKGSKDEKRWLGDWVKAFREVLIPNLKDAQFADMFAQTLSYGLFAAKVHSGSGKDFSRAAAAHSVPKTNPFLRKLFEEFAGVGMPETFDWAVEDLVELLRHAAMDKVMKDFGKGSVKGDPVLHFYETFLKSYDPKIRKLRGVYYTPESVVTFIVRSVDLLLKTRFGRANGLADENTLILDPATGTATFLYFVIAEIYQQFAKQRGGWDGYVSAHLLNRLFGFELLMAPYAVAHLKLGMELQRTGYSFGSNQRLGIYLTNSLERAAKKSESFAGVWISDEANAAARIKEALPIMVVLGNPPYSGISANRSVWITDLIKTYRVVDGKPLGEKKVWLSDDYVKFIRFGQWRIQQTGQGILAFITNNGYLDNPTFRGMRQALMAEFSDIYVLDLHGSSKKKEKSPDGGMDQNVFDIQQGVAIAFFIKDPGRQGCSLIHHAQLWGTRLKKYDALSATTIETTKWHQVTPARPYYFFAPQKDAFRSEYQKGWSVADVFSISNSGIVTARDEFVLDLDKERLRKRLELFRDKDVDDLTAKAKLDLSENYAWRVAEARKELRAVKNWETYFTEMLYRPFNSRHIYFHSSVVWRPRHNVMDQMSKENLALITTRQTRDEFGALVTSKIAGHKSVAAYDINSVFPLYVYPMSDQHSRGQATLNVQTSEWTQGAGGRYPNLTRTFALEIEKRVGLRPESDGTGDLVHTFGPEDAFNYLYAIVYSPTYRQRYIEFLRTDFPRVPVTGNKSLFKALVKKGAELVALHLMTSKRLDSLFTGFPKKGSNEIGTVDYSEDNQRIWINGTQYFEKVPAVVWNFYVGGYQVCEKWLKDRKGRTLTWADLQHFQRVVVALNETIGLMADIDLAVDKHGGWPIT
ncbi:MAG: type ISP restriction/modification enzyme [Bryobacteraceae bacterium]